MESNIQDQCTITLIENDTYYKYCKFEILRYI